jgi:hypothetical protein
MPAMLTRIAAVLAALTVVAAATWAQQRPPPVGSPLDGFDHPRTIHWTPDGRLLVADLGTGHNDGRVVAIDLLGTGKQQVLMKNLPSTRKRGSLAGELAGPSAAAMAADGTVCVVISGANKPNSGFATLRCADGLVFDFAHYEAATNLDRRDIASDPFDIVWDQDRAWLISDAAAHTVIRVFRSGAVSWNFAFTNLPAWPTDKAPVPTGLSFSQTGRGDQTLAVALLDGGVALLDPAGKRPPILAPGLTCQCIAIVSPTKPTFILDHGSSQPGGSIIGQLDSPVIQTWVAGLDRPTGAVVLPSSPQGHAIPSLIRFIVAEEARGRLRIVSPTIR